MQDEDEEDEDEEQEASRPPRCSSVSRACRSQSSRAMLRGRLTFSRPLVASPDH